MESLSLTLTICEWEKEVILRLLGTVMMSHGHAVDDLLYSTVVSLSKDVLVCLSSSSENNHGIDPCYSISKLIDVIVINKYGKYLYSMLQICNWLLRLDIPPHYVPPSYWV